MEVEPRLDSLLADLQTLQLRKRQGLITREHANNFFRLVVYLELHLNSSGREIGLGASLNARTFGKNYGLFNSVQELIYSGPQTSINYADREFSVTREAAKLGTWGEFKDEGLVLSLKFPVSKDKSPMIIETDICPTVLLRSEHLTSLGYRQRSNAISLDLLYSNELLDCKKLFSEIRTKV